MPRVYAIFFPGVGMLSVLFRQLMIYLAIVFHWADEENYFSTCQFNLV